MIECMEKESAKRYLVYSILYARFSFSLVFEFG